ncbi:MAG TPA: hypothetical protein VLI39_18765 [Sedimentisphaerales bacterium]|nr:hypothetical protein [Sedimentisphaerales bacterium]
MRHRTMWVVLVAAATVLSLAGAAGAAFEDWAIGAKAGTLGIGGELTTSLLPDVHLRGGVQWFGFDFEAEFDDIDYDVDIDLLNPMLVLDWYPFSGSFRVSAGVVFNNSDITLDATLSEPIEIGGSTYDPADVGSLRGESDFDDIAPYIGIGFGNPLSSDGRWGFMTEAGVAFIGSPNVKLRATGPFANDPALPADLAQEEEEIEDDMDAIRIYPVLSMALYYRF